MYHKLPVGAIAAGGGIAAASGLPTLAEVGIGLIASAALLAAVTVARKLRSTGRR